MKKRILSFLLIACMLVTMVPVMSSAAEEAVAVEAPSATNADYAELYVQDGLVHAYMAFGTSDPSYDLTAGVWYDLVGSANASITGGVYGANNLDGWQVGDLGGIFYENRDSRTAGDTGIKWTLGSEAGKLDLPDTFTVEYLSRTDFRSVPQQWNNATITSAPVADSTDTLYTLAVSKINFSTKCIYTYKCAAANTQYTVKVNGANFTFTSRPDGTYVNATGMPSKVTSYTVQCPEGVTLESMTYMINSQELNVDQAFAFGALRAMIWSNLVGHNSWGNGWGDTRWFVGNNGWGGSGSGCVRVGGDDRALPDADGRTTNFTVTRAPATFSTENDSFTYSIKYGLANYGTATFNQTYTPKAGDVCGALDQSKEAFQVQCNMPGAVYSLRIYDVKIDDAAKAQNHFVDIMAYARFDIDTFEALSAETKTALYNHFADAEIEGKTAEDIANVIARLAGTKTAADTLYVQDGLTGLFVPDFADITADTWYNMVEGGFNATMRGNWTENVDGTLRVNHLFYGTKLTDGSYQTGLYATHEAQRWSVDGSYLDLGAANVPDNDLTVSVTASVYQIKAVDILTGQKTASWADGKKWDGNPATLKGSSPVYSEVFRVQIGYFGCFNMLGTYGANANSRWAYTTGGWQKCGDWGGTMGGDLAIFRNKLDTGYYTETITRDEIAVDATATEAAYTKATFTIWNDAVSMKSGTFKSNNASNPIYQTDESAGGFHVLRAFPADVVSVAVYSKVLSVAEMKQNIVADIATYYGLDVSGLLKAGNEAKLEAFLTLAADFRMDAATYLVKKAAYQGIIDTMLKGSSGEGEAAGYDAYYVQDNLIALYSIFDKDEAQNALDLAIIANKASNDTGAGISAAIIGPMYHLDDATGHYYGWQVGANGGIKTAYTKNLWQRYVSGKTLDTGKYTAVTLDKNLLDNDTTTVEIVMQIEPLMNPNGTVYETNVTEAKYGMYNSQEPTFSFGMWRATAFIAKGHSGASYGQDRWCYHNGNWAQHNGDYTGGKLSYLAYRANFGIDDVILYTLIQEKVVGETTTNSKVTISWDIDKYSQSGTSTGANNVPTYMEPETGIFRLLAGIGGTLYAVRVYSDKLTTAEQEHNHFIDILAYHKFDTGVLALMTESQMALAATQYKDAEPDDVAKAALDSYISCLTGAAAANSLYVTEGLTGLYTAYNNDSTVDVNAHMWINKVDGEVINLAGTWKHANNGITNGTMYYGRANPLEDYYTKTTLYSRDTSKNNTWTHTNYVNLGIDKLPTKDFTVEIVSRYYEIGLLADDGSWQPMRTWTPTYWYKKTEGGVTTTISAAAAQTSTDTITYELIGIGYTEARGYVSNSKSNAFGHYKAFSSCGGNFEGEHLYTYRWYVAEAGGGWGNSGYNTPSDNRANCWESSATRYSTVPGSIQTKTITRDFADDESAVTYEVSRNFEHVVGDVWPVTGSYTASKTYPVAAETEFFLFANEWVDLYSIRIYDRLLTDAEELQNRAADVINYYGLDTSKYLAYDADVRASVNTVLAGIDFSAAKESVQAILDSGAKAGATAYDDAYVQSGLVALFTAYGADSSVNLVSGVWDNKVENGTDATIEGYGSHWRYGANGGISYDLTYSRWKTRNYVGIHLDAAYASLDEFTVETVASVRPMLNDYTDDYYVSHKGVATHDDENGVTIPAMYETYGIFASNLGAFRFGWLNALAFQTIRSNKDNNAAGMYRWYVSPQYYNAHGGAASNAGLFQAVGNENYNYNNNFASYSAQYVKANAANGGETYTVKYANKAQVSTTLTAAKITELEALNPGGYQESLFSLFNGQSSTVYAIRVYDRTLSDAEYLQNHFVDIAAYFGLDISRLPVGGEAEIYEAFEKITVDDDAAYVKALYGFYIGDVDSLAETLGAHVGYAPLLDEPGYRVLFGIDPITLDIFKTDYTVNYGAIVAIGEWGAETINTLEDLEVTVNGGNVTTAAPNAQVVLVGSSADKELKHEDIGDRLIYSVSVTANAAEYGAGVLVRGFYTITDAQGETLTYYMDPAEDGALSGAISVMEAADYFVNEYDANVALAYKYMANETLLTILSSCGISARTGMGGDLTIYVDAVNGSDANNGLTAATAVKTMAAAYAAMKAHLASASATGVTLELAAGTYNVDSVLSLNGNEIAPDDYSITIKGAGADTIITGEKTIDKSNATQGGFGEYIINIANKPDFRYVWRNGEVMNLISAGDPENYFDIQFITTTNAEGKATSAKFYAPASYITDLSAMGVDASFVGTEVQITTEWDFNIFTVTSVDFNDMNASGDVAVYVDPAQFNNAAIPDNHTINGREYWMENSAGIFYSAGVFLGAEGYTYDEKSGNLYINDTAFADATYTYSALENIFVFEDVTGLTMTDLTITGLDNKFITEQGGLSGGQSGSNSYTDATGAKKGGNYTTCAAISAKNISNSVFDGLIIKNVGNDGINIRGAVSNVEIINNEITHVGATAIRVGAKNGTANFDAYNKDVTIANNFISNTGEVFVQCSGMLVTNGANLSVIGNTIVNTTYTAMSIGWVWSTTDITMDEALSGTRWNLVNVEIAYNYIANFMTCMRDGGGIYILGGNVNPADPESTNTYFNYLHDNYMVITEETGKHDGERWFMGYYFDGSSTNWYEYSNVLVNATETITLADANNKMVGYYVQGINSQLTYNIKLYGNYAIGFDSATLVYRNANRISADRNVVANDYIFADIAMNSPVVGSKIGNATSIAAPATAKADVANAFFTAGSTINSSVKTSGGVATAGGAKVERDLVFVGGKANVSDKIDGLTPPVYAVTVMSDGKVLATYELASGATFTLDLADPTKDRAEHSSFVFKGWKNYTPGMEILANVTIEAEFEEVIDKHIVTFMNGDVEHATVEIPYGSVIGDYLAEVEDPTKEMTPQSKFTFTGWLTDPDRTVGVAVDDVVVEGDMSVYADYKTEGRYYTAIMYVIDPATGEKVEIGKNTGCVYGQSTHFYNGDAFTIYHPNYRDKNAEAYAAFMEQYMPADTENVQYSYSNKFVPISGDMTGRFTYNNLNSDDAYSLWSVTIKEDTEFLLTWDESYRVNVNGTDKWYVAGDVINFADFVEEGAEISGATLDGVALDDLTSYTVSAEDAGKSLVISTASAYLAGDLDGSGVVTATDAGWLYEIIAGTKTVEDCYGLADLDGSGAVTATDAGWLYEIIAGTRDGETLEPIA